MITLTRGGVLASPTHRKELNMAVLIEAFSVVTSIESIENKYSGGLVAFQKSCPEGTFCIDSSIVSRIGFATLNDADNFAFSLVDSGFSYIVNEVFDEIAVLDQFYGLVIPCWWLEFGSQEIFNGKQKISICQVKGSTSMGTSVPISWCYSNAEGRRCMSIDKTTMRKRFIFLRHEGVFDYYLDILTNKKCYFENTAREKRH